MPHSWPRRQAGIRTAPALGAGRALTRGGRTATPTSLPAIKRVLLIANPVSGGGRGRRLAAELAAALEQRGAEPQVQHTTPDRNGQALAADPGTGDFDALVVVGGRWLGR